MSETSPATRGVHHVGLTVPDLAGARAFFTDTLGFQQVGERPEYPSVFVSDGSVMITLWQVSDPASCVAFDRKNNVGLHHLALQVESSEALDALHARLAATDGVSIEFIQIGRMAQAFHMRIAPHASIKESNGTTSRTVATGSARAAFRSRPVPDSRRRGAR